MIVGIRCDGNDKVASGHVTRTLTIAEALRRQGAEVRFFAADDSTLRMLRLRMDPASDYPVTVLGTDYRDLCGELPVLTRELTACGAEVLLIDSYFADAAYAAGLKKSCPSLKMAWMDDTGDAPAGIGLIVNYVAPETARIGTADGGTILKGPAYTPLREQFADARMPVREKVRTVFVSTGGSDLYGFAAALSVRVEEVLPGVACRIPQGIREMAAYMAECDLAVSAGGTTVYELCAVGVPTVFYTMADNQLALAAGIGASAENAGDIRDPQDRAAALDRIGEWLLRMAGSAEARRTASLRERQLTDGAGADRIALEILRLH